MKKIVSILLLFTLVFQCFSEFTTLIGFELNRKYIAEHLCINRDHPELDCEGECYLQKEMQHNEDQKDHSGLVKSMMTVVLFFAEDQADDLFVSNMEKTNYPPFIEGDYLSPSFGFFRPPMA